jgi:hypothetical protein
MTFALRAPSDNVDEWQRDLMAHVPDVDIRILGQTTGATLVAMIFQSVSVRGIGTALFAAAAAAAIRAVLSSSQLRRSTQRTPP